METINLLANIKRALSCEDEDVCLFLLGQVSTEANVLLAMKATKALGPLWCRLQALAPERAPRTKAFALVRLRKEMSALM